MSREIHMSQTARPARRMQRKTLYIVATTICIGIYVGLLAMAGDQPWLIWPGLGAMFLSMVFACLWMATLDEAAQQAHYIAWFWGGSAGLVVSMLLFLSVMLRPEAFEAILSPLGVAYSFGGGIAIGVLPPALGYLIWWAVLWLRRG